MEQNELYYCYGLNKSNDGKMSQLFLIKVLTNEAREWSGYELLPPMNAECAEKLNIEGLSIKRTENGAEIVKNLITRRLPSVQMGSGGVIEPVLIPFVGKYHRLNPQKIWPSKPNLFRTITVLGETVRPCKRYITYWMTNRKIQVLDEDHIEYGYYVCDYNGAVAYLTFERMQLIGNRYGFTNARVKGNRVAALDGSLLPQFACPENPLDIRTNSSVCYIKDDVSTQDYDISVMRRYADTFFSIRCQHPGFDESSPEEVVNKALGELLSSVEAFHQALLWNSVPKKEYKRICERADRFFSDDIYSYSRIKSEISSRVKTPYFQSTAAFDTMLEKCGSNTKRIAALQTLTSLSKDIQDKFCAILLAEQEITPVLMELGQKFGYKLLGLDYRIKSPDSLYEKLYERSNDTQKSLETLLEETRDVLRYTICFDRDEDYCQNIIVLLTEIMNRYSGQMECFRNYWTPYVSGEYKGINVCVRLPYMCWDMREKCLKGAEYIGARYSVTIPSFCFEVQFHTQSSLEVKEKNHKLYEQSRRSDASPEERQRCNAEMKKNISSIAVPQGAEYLNMMSNEYIKALRDSIRLMQGELSDIEKQNNPYVSAKGQ